MNEHYFQPLQVDLSPGVEKSGALVPENYFQFPENISPRKEKIVII